ncbi:hypothetical protein BDQ17DRAFT_1327750 [Cyathus striatus]|nr:hypothetical protein BDQ17DRAFT_1327750 [Cyathus striatus]
MQVRTDDSPYRTGSLFDFSKVPRYIRTSECTGAVLLGGRGVEMKQDGTENSAVQHLRAGTIKRVDIRTCNGGMVRSIYITIDADGLRAPKIIANNEPRSGERPYLTAGGGWSTMQTHHGPAIFIESGAYVGERGRGKRTKDTNESRRVWGTFNMKLSGSVMLLAHGNKENGMIPPNTAMKA